jgi:hypothetical protein
MKQGRSERQRKSSEQQTQKQEQTEKMWETRLARQFWTYAMQRNLKTNISLRGQ